MISRSRSVVWYEIEFKCWDLEYWLLGEENNTWNSINQGYWFYILDIECSREPPSFWWYRWEAGIFSDLPCYISWFLPLEYIQRNKVTKKVFDEQGQHKGAGGTKIPSISSKESISTLDRESKLQFLDCARSMLRCLLQEQKNATELLQHPWMAGAIPSLNQ